MPKVIKMSINFELLKVDRIISFKISSHEEAKNIKFGKQVNLIQRILLGTLPQEVVMSLPHNHMTLTNVSLVTKELLLSNLGSKNNSLMEVGHFSIEG